ncbi:unnamed protein product [Rhizophagus irregularis]|nr:unnamed protein product [Rhizophagus irregularis]CAB5328134.1 unnamed protein product [Rhizophagus irregularis]
MRLQPGHTAQNSDYLAIARKSRFIFLKNQYVKNSIRHLTYKKAFTEPNPEDYPFLVPFYAKRHPNDRSREWFTYMYNLEISIREKEEQEHNERIDRFEREVAESFQAGFEANRA